MANIYNLFKFLEDKKGKEIPFKVKLLHAPETLTKEELNVKGNLFLYNIPISSLPNNFQVGGSLFLKNTPISSLPDNLKVGGNLNLRDTKISSLPDNLTVKGDLFLKNTPLAKKYLEEQIRKMIEKKGGEVKGAIYT